MPAPLGAKQALSRTFKLLWLDTVGGKGCHKSQRWEDLLSEQFYSIITLFSEIKSVVA